MAWVNLGNSEGNSNFGFNALDHDSTPEEHGTLGVQDEAMMNYSNDTWSLTYNASSGDQFPVDMHDYASQFPGERDSFIRYPLHNQDLEGDAFIDREGPLEQQHSSDFDAWPQDAISNMDENGNLTKALQHSSLTTHNVQDAPFGGVAMQQTCSNRMMPDDEHLGLAASPAASEPYVTLVTMSYKVYNDPDKNWLAPRRKYPSKDGEFYCPQCLNNLWRGSQKLTLQQLANISPKSYPKTYSRSGDVRRHLRKKH